MSDELKAPNLIVMSHQPTRFEDAWRLLTRLKESGDFPQLDASIDEAIKHLHTRGLPDPQSYSLEEIKAENTKDGCLRWCLLLGMILKAEQCLQITDDEASVCYLCLQMTVYGVKKKP